MCVCMTQLSSWLAAVTVKRGHYNQQRTCFLDVCAVGYMTRSAVCSYYVDVTWQVDFE